MSQPNLTALQNAQYQQYTMETYILATQREAKVVPRTVRKTIEADIKAYNRNGETEPTQKVELLQPTPITPFEYDRRCLVVKTYHIAKAVDHDVKATAITNVDSDIAAQIRRGFIKLADKLCIDAMFGSATIETRNLDSYQPTFSSVSLPKTQEILPLDKTGNAHGTPNNQAFWTALKHKFGKNKISERIYVLMTPDIEAALFEIEEFKNRDYTSDELLNNTAEVVRWHGLYFVKSTDEIVRVTKQTSFSGVKKSGILAGQNKARFADGSGTGTAIPIANGSREVPVWVQSGIYFGSNTAHNMSRETELPNNSFGKMFYSQMSYGGLRMEDTKVCKLYIKEV